MLGALYLYCVPGADSLKMRGGLSHTGNLFVDQGSVYIGQHISIKQESINRQKASMIVAVYSVWYRSESGRVVRQVTTFISID